MDKLKICSGKEAEIHFEKCIEFFNKEFINRGIKISMDNKHPVLSYVYIDNSPSHHRKIISESILESIALKDPSEY